MKYAIFKKKVKRLWTDGDIITSYRVAPFPNDESKHEFFEDAKKNILLRAILTFGTRRKYILMSIFIHFTSYSINMNFVG